MSPVSTLLIALLSASSLQVPSQPLASTRPDDLVVVVVDATGGRVAGATVIVRRSTASTERLETSEADGRTVFSGLAPARYHVEVRATGFRPVSTNVDVPAAEPRHVRLEPAPVVEEVQVVSASRQEELRDSLNMRVDVLTRARIEESGATTVAEALRELPGFVSRRGSETGSAAGEQIQGVDSRQVLVLVDGQPIPGARGIKRGAINLDRQSTERLERIEVVKGAASALYGSDAMGGVVNLITREPVARLEGGARLAGGSHGDLVVGAEGALRRDRFSGLVTIGRQQRDGFDLTPSTFDTTGAPFRRSDYLAKARVGLSADASLAAMTTGYRNRTRGRSSGELGPQEDDILERAVNAGVSLDWRLSPSASLQVRGHHAAYDEDSSGFLAPPASTPLAPGALDERIAKADAALSASVGTRQFVQGGVEWWRNAYDGINRLRDEGGHVATTGVAWGQHRIALGSRVTATTGVRVDAHSAFGTAVSPKAGVNVRILDGLRGRASYGRGFRAPDLGQLYYRFLNPTNFYQVIGNPDLRAEHSNSFQAGAEFVTPGRRARLAADWFHNDVDDLIESVNLGSVATPAQLEALIAREGLDPSFRPVLGRLLFVYRNLNDVVTQGVEIDGEVALTRAVTIGGAYSGLHARDRARDQPLTGRHPHQGHVRLGWQLERVGLRANLRGTFYSEWVAARTTASDGTSRDTRAPAFALWDAYLSQRILRPLTAFVSLENLADSRDPNTGVLLPSGAPAAIYRPDVGRTVRVGLRWAWAAN